MDTYLAVVQTATVLAAVGGLFVALRIAGDDRREARRIAEEDRATARREAERRHRLDLLLRLSANFEQGGSTDPAERHRMGAEAGALITALGPEVLPELFAGRGSIDEAQKQLDSVSVEDWDWRHKADAVAIALHRISLDERGA